jgi:hypothetical protein
MPTIHNFTRCQKRSLKASAKTKPRNPRTGSQSGTSRKKKKQKETSRCNRTDEVVLKNTHSKIIKKSIFTRQLLLNLILDENYILTGLTFQWIGEKLISENAKTRISTTNIRRA